MNAQIDTRAGVQIPGYKALASVLFVFLLVLPHSFQVASGIAFGTLVALSFGVLVRDGYHAKTKALLPAILVSVTVNIAYIVVGLTRGAPLAGIIQAVAIFVLAPMGWFIVGSAIRQRFSEIDLYRLFEGATLLACLSVALFFYLFLTVGPEATRIFITNPNVLIQGGAISATMHVYASLIFLAGFMLAMPEIYRKGPRQFIVPLAVIVASITSGRSALILACFVGVFLGLFLRMVVRTSDPGGAQNRTLRIIGFSIGAGILLALIGQALGVVDFAKIVTDLGEDIASGGGLERNLQYDALVAGIGQTNGLGAGHGIGVAYVRDFENPWRYEIFALSALYKLGFFGFALSLAPFAFYIFKFGQAAIRRQISDLDAILFAGWTAMAIASFSNPYPESFIFQALLYLPVLLFSYPLDRPQS